MNIDWNTVIETFKDANITLLVTVFLLNIIERFEITYKWNLLIRIRGILVAFGRLFWINSIGSFLGLFLPSSLGTDVVRGYYLMKNNSEKSVSISSIFVDRVLGIFSLLLLGAISVFFAGDLISRYNIQTNIIVVFLLVIVFFYLFQKEQSAILLEKLLKKLKHKKVIEYGMKLHSSILEYKKYPRTLVISFVLTILVQVTRVVTYYFVALSFNIQISAIYYFLFVPIIMMVIMIPISIGGLGVKEGTFVAFFTLVGMSVNDALIISFANSLIDTINTLFLGGGAYLFYNPPTKNQVTSEVNKN
jgi:uncharacterized protein (TIRG00374 family)